MTPAEIELAARQKYNAVNDTFWSSSEIMGYIYDACLEMATETHCIENTFTTSTVADQQEYEWPANAISIKRIEVDGLKLVPITFREDDLVSQTTSTTSVTGAPQYYTVWDEVFALRPIPSSILDMKVYAVCEPQAVTSTSVLEVPSAFHNIIVHYVTAEMASKDENFATADRLQAKFDKGLMRLKKHMRKMKRGDSFASVQSEDTP